MTYAAVAGAYPPATAAAAGILFAVIVLLLFSALMSGAEVAFSSREIRRNASGWLKTADDAEKLLPTMLLARTILNTFIVMLWFHLAAITVQNPEQMWWNRPITVAGAMLLILLTTDLLSRAIAGKYAAAFMRIASGPLRILQGLLNPLSSFLIRSSSLISHRNRENHSGRSIEELSQALELNTQDQTYDDREILKGIVKFGDKSVAGIMRSRVDVVALNLNDHPEHVLNIINESGYSRIPVFSETFDHVKGILYIKDLLPFIGGPGDFPWTSILRPPFFVPESKKIDDLLEEFQKNKVHMAIVVDEYGGSSGIVTLQDILEEIVGDFLDEFDEDEHYATQLGDNLYLFDGRIQLDDFCRFTGTDSQVFDPCKGEADTLAGLILELKGEIPGINEHIAFQNFIFIIDAVDNRRIKKIRVKITQPDSNATSENDPY